MLASLIIKNVVLIEHLTIEFRQGLCALTGETGAGKSILLDSLGLALGARSDSGLVGKGSEQASVTAVFEVNNNHPILSFLHEQDLESNTDLILRRNISKEGRSKAYINDQPVSVSLLKQAGEMLVEIHGQFDTQQLLSSQYHIDLLDEYADHHSLLEEIQTSWKYWQDCLDKLKNLRDKIDKARDDEEYFRISLEDLDSLSLKENEEENLTILRDRLMSREKILENLNNAEMGLQEIENISGTVWRALERLGDDGKEASQVMNRANAEIQEVSLVIQNLLGDLDKNEFSLEEIDDRLFALKAQARKHNCSINDLPNKREEISQFLNGIENQDQLLSDLVLEAEKAKRDYQSKAENLSTLRIAAAKKLSGFIMKELPPLKLEKASFEVLVEALPEEQWNAKGANKVQFLVAMNPGTEPGPIHKVASGGEMARLMLALKVVLAEVGTAGSLVFDEVDSGVGGATAAAVGEHLAKLSEYRQVLVVTHSPQVAAMAQNHWIVSKGGQKNMVTNIVPLSDLLQRQEEIARMLAGAEITDEARAAANKLLESSAA